MFTMHAGLDGLSTRLLKDAARIVAGLGHCLTVLIYLCKRLYSLTTFRQLKPKVSPIFKEGKKSDCRNYRPISVISVIAKMFEKICLGGIIYQYRARVVFNAILCTFIQGRTIINSFHLPPFTTLGHTKALDTVA